MPSSITRRRLGWGVALLLWSLTLSLLLTYSSVRLQDPLEQVRRFTRADEFDFLTWTFDAAAAKLSQGSLGSTDYLVSCGIGVPGPEADGKRTPAAANYGGTR